MRAYIASASRVPSRVRRAGAEDATAIAAAHLRAFHATYAGVLDAEHMATQTLDVFLRRHRTKLGEPENVYLIAEEATTEGERIVGFVRCGPIREPVGGCTGEVHALYITPERQRMGHGTRLFEAALEELHSAGHARVAVFVLAKNEGARRFYEAIGGATLGADWGEVGGRLYRRIAYGWMLRRELGRTG